MSVDVETRTPAGAARATGGANTWEPADKATDTPFTVAVNTVPPPASRPAVPAPPPAPAAPLPSVSSSYSESPAVAVLLKQANNQISVGKHDQAATTLERALRIAPENAMLWLRLAELKEQQGDRAQAASMARKAVQLAPGDDAIRLRASRLSGG